MIKVINPTLSKITLEDPKPTGRWYLRDGEMFIEIDLSKGLYGPQWVSEKDFVEVVGDKQSRAYEGAYQPLYEDKGFAAREQAEPLDYRISDCLADKPETFGGIYRSYKDKAV